MIFKGKRVVVTGGTGSLGMALVRRILSGKEGLPGKIVVFSRDEAKQHDMRLHYRHTVAATDEIVYNNFNQLLEFVIGDVRDYHRVAGILRDADIVFNAAALKQVPTCEYFPFEATQTNILGPENIVRAIQENRCPVETVIGISTDKACQPVNTYGATKMLMERLFAESSVEGTTFTCVRYGNVVGSTGSVIPLFQRQYAETKRVKVTNPDMTRFWMSIDEAIDLIVIATGAQPGSIVVPMPQAMKMQDVARAATKDNVDIDLIGERPGEKHHEMLVQFEESVRVSMCSEPNADVRARSRIESWYELMPPGTERGTEPFTLASHSPNYWMTTETMRSLIEDASRV